MLRNICLKLTDYKRETIKPMEVGNEKYSTIYISFIIQILGLNHSGNAIRPKKSGLLEFIWIFIHKSSKDTVYDNVQ